MYITKILPVFHGCETWSVTLREEHRLRVIENRMLSKIFGTKVQEVTRDNYIVRGFMLYTPLHV
jgi:hypothetical protein